MKLFIKINIPPILSFTSENNTNKQITHETKNKRTPK